MSKAPASPSFRPPNNDRLKATLPRLAALSLTTPATNPQPTTDKEEISPVQPLEPSITLEPPPEERKKPQRLSLNINILPPKESRTPSPPASRPRSSSRGNSSGPDDDIHALDEEGWMRVANAGGIEEMLVLGEGVSGAVAKCRLRKSGQVFAIKVPPSPNFDLFADYYN
jgi:hypothetical protein